MCYWDLGADCQMPYSTCNFEATSLCLDFIVYKICRIVPTSQNPCQRLNEMMQVKYLVFKKYWPLLSLLLLIINICLFSFHKIWGLIERKDLEYFLHLARCLAHCVWLNIGWLARWLAGWMSSQFMDKGTTKDFIWMFQTPSQKSCLRAIQRISPWH